MKRCAGDAVNWHPRSHSSFRGRRWLSKPSPYMNKRRGNMHRQEHIGMFLLQVSKWPGVPCPYGLGGSEFEYRKTTTERCWVSSSSSEYRNDWTSSYDTWWGQGNDRPDHQPHQAAALT